MDFDSERKGTGTMEWAEVTENICLGCTNNCQYCYAAHNADRFGTKARSDWANEVFTKRSRITSYPFKEGVIMFPSAHDITPFNVQEYIRVARLMLEAGNRLLIVSKPRIDCTCSIINALIAWKDQILFRFTIGSVDAEVCALWEPNAPTPFERMNALQYAYQMGFRTSVSIEPLLGGAVDAIAIVDSVYDHVTDTIWIGKMNKVELRVAIDSETMQEAVEYINSCQSDAEMLSLYSALKSDPKIRWKDSINLVLKRAGIK